MRVVLSAMELVYTSTQKWRSNGIQSRQEQTFANMAFASPTRLPRWKTRVRYPFAMKGRTSSVGWRILVVVYTWRNEQIRLISVRLATQTERRQYEDGYEEG